MLTAELRIEPGTKATLDATHAAALSIVLPVHNEAANLPHTLDAVARWSVSTRLPVEVLVVDDDSMDGTRAAAAAFERRLPLLKIHRNLEKRGAVESARTGVLVAAAPVVLLGDHRRIARNLPACAALLAAVIDGADVAVWNGTLREPGAVDGDESSGLAEVCVDWIKRTLRREHADAVENALKAVRTDAAQRLLTLAQFHGWEDEIPWMALAAQAHCRIVSCGGR